MKEIIRDQFIELKDHPDSSGYVDVDVDNLSFVIMRGGEPIAGIRRKEGDLWKIWWEGGPVERLSWKGGEEWTIHCLSYSFDVPCHDLFDVVAVIEGMYNFGKAFSK